MSKKNNILCSYNDINIDFNDSYKEYIIDNLDDNIYYLEQKLKDTKEQTETYKEIKEEIKEKQEEIKKIKSNEIDVTELDGYWNFIESELEWMWEDFENCVSDNFVSGLYLIDGAAGLWNGNQNVYTIKYYNDFQDLRKDLYSYDYIDFRMYENKNLYIKGIHHDGINTYNFISIENLSKYEIKELIEENYDIEDIRENARDWYNKSYSQLTKDELIDLLSTLI